jgi:uncharacterized membrane protein
MFSVRSWAMYAFIIVLLALPIWALSNANGAIQEQTWLLLAIAYVLVALVIVAIRIYVRLGELIEAVSGQGTQIEQQLKRPSLPPPAYGPPSVYAPHPEYDPPPPAVGRRPAR